MRALILGIDRLSLLVGYLVSVLVPGMVIVLAIEVVSRYVFDAPTLWVYDTATFMFGYCGLLAGAFAMRERAHINVDILYARLSKRVRAGLDVVTGLLTFFFLILVILYTWPEAMTAIARGTRRPSEWAPPVGHYVLLIPVSAGLVLLQGLANWVRSLHLVVTGRELDA